MCIVKHTKRKKKTFCEKKMAEYIIIKLTFGIYRVLKINGVKKIVTNKKFT